ncbi:MAG: transporter involved in cytochrome c biosis, CcmB subunit [Thermoleophilia bacterium]|nr:transporter involved in cytochrome c biosis, CcmB subunit [Thermoleophilia bacterium]
MSWLRTPLAIAAHDLGRELRRPVASSAVLLFGVSSLVVLRVALAGGAKPDDSVLAGALWIVLVFAALVGAARAWAAEREDGAFDALLAAPASRTAIHAGKVLVALATTLVLDAVLVGLYLALFGAPHGAGNIALLLASVVLAAGGFSTVGVLVAGLGLRARSRDLLGPAMFLPLALPLVIAAVTASLHAYGGGRAEPGQLLLFLAAYDATFLVAGLAAFPELAVE